MYVVIFEYKNGKKGTCMIGENPIVFGTEEEATFYAKTLNDYVAGSPEGFFPVWKACKARD